METVQEELENIEAHLALYKARTSQPIHMDVFHVLNDLRDSRIKVESEKADARASEMMLRQICEERDSLRKINAEHERQSWVNVALSEQLARARNDLDFSRQQHLTDRSAYIKKIEELREELHKYKTTNGPINTPNSVT